jgi:hypothetical protein
MELSCNFIIVKMTGLIKPIFGHSEKIIRAEEFSINHTDKVHYIYFISLQIYNVLN